MHEQRSKEGKAEGGSNAPLLQEGGNNQEKDGKGEGAADLSA
jgi:hypothetical protein